MVDWNRVTPVILPTGQGGSVVVVVVVVVVKVVVVDTRVVVEPMHPKALGEVVVHITVELQVPQRADRELIMVMVLAPLLTFLKYQLII
jgi:hypothetical protein